MTQKLAYTGASFQCEPTSDRRFDASPLHRIFHEVAPESGRIRDFVRLLHTSGISSLGLEAGLDYPY